MLSTNWVAARATRAGVLALALCACAAAPTTASLPAPEGPCSELSSAVYSWARTGSDTCQTTPSRERELIPLGGGLIFAFEADTGLSLAYRMAADKSLGEGPVEDRADTSDVATGTLLYPVGPMRVLQAAPLSTGYHVYSVENDPASGRVFGPYLSSPTWNEPFFWGHELLELDDGNILQWWLGTGAYTVFHYDQANEAMQPLATTSFGGTLPALERGARVLNLGQHRLLAWTPANGQYNIWSYQFQTGAPAIFDTTPVAQGTWTDPGPGDDVVVSDVDPSISPTGRAILIWERATGRVRTRVLDPTAADPMSGAPIADDTYTELITADWHPPTQSSITNAVYVLQQGRTFDSYFGQYCTAAPGSNPSCVDGPSCCEGEPTSVPGAAACTPLEPITDTYVPSTTIACGTAEIDGGKMDGFASVASPPMCGDPRNFVCAGTGGAAGLVGTTYQLLATQGTVDDRTFATTLGPALLNIIYLNKTGYGLSIATESGAQITELLANAHVRWALYVSDPTTVTSTYMQSPPKFYDPHWTFFRSVDELPRDVELGQLPDISIVISGAPNTEAPGDGPPEAGMSFVSGVVSAVTGSPTYSKSALVIVTHLTSGGFYDHVPPPTPLPVAIDSETGADGNPTGVPYGPRVPLLALGPFVHPNTISHASLELSSLAVFLEWNWLGAAGVGIQGHRDQVVANLGSLLDPTKTGVAVPTGALRAP